MLLIFVTNYVEYSLQGYEVQAFRYLLKAEMPQKLERYVQQALPHTARPAIRFAYFAMARMSSCSRSRSCTPRCRPQGMPAPAGPTGPCCTRPLPWPIWLTYWKTTASCAHTKRFGQYGAHPRSAKHATVSARRNRAAGQLAHSQRRAENLYAVEEREEMGYWLGSLSAAWTCCAWPFCDAFLEKKQEAYAL